MTGASPSPSIMLCTLVTDADGTDIKCQVLDYPIYDKDSLVPAMLVRGIKEKVNPVNLALVPMGKFFVQKVAS